MAIKLPKVLDHLPEKPINGNYILLGQNEWATAESLTEAYKHWHSRGPILKKGLWIVDVSDDFRISHLDGSVRATKLDEVFTLEK